MHDADLDISVYPMLNVGSLAGFLSSRMESLVGKLTVINSGFTIQGMGFPGALVIYAAFIDRLMTRPQDSMRPGCSSRLALSPSLSLELYDHESWICNP